MCGRFVLNRQTDDLVALFDVNVVGDRLPAPSWNIAPTRPISVVIDSLPRATAPDDFPEPVRRMEAARWGLVPAGAEAPAAGAALFNARSEEVAEQAPFRNAVKIRRTVIPASGYYEWRTIDGAKVPHFVSLPGDELMLFAGLYEWWRNPAVTEDALDRWLLSATILTRPSAAGLAAIHDRMPVFLDADLVEEWLDPQEEGSQELVDHVAAAGSPVAERSQFHRVGVAVDSVQNDDEQLVMPLA
jgi:putative SOS response-associated peptidase YedK